MSEERTLTMFELVQFAGWSPWCAAREGQPHEPCTQKRCSCPCHRKPA